MLHRTISALICVWRFWRDTILTAGLVVSAGLAYARFEGGAEFTFVLCVGRLLITAVLVYLLSQSRRSRELDYYAALGVGAGRMMWGVAVADYALFLALLVAAAQLG